MYYLNVWLKTTDAANVETVAEALKRVGEKSRKEDGCLRWEAYRSQAEPDSFLLVEQWNSRAHWEAHRNGEAVQVIYLKEVIPLVERTAHPCDLIG